MKAACNDLLDDRDARPGVKFADAELIAIEPGDTTSRRFAMAVDLGTTTVVANLLDLDTGTPVAVRSMLNKQQPFGADVISRISATMMDPDALAKLRDLAHETLAELTDEVLAAGEIEPDHPVTLEVHRRPRGLQRRGGRHVPDGADDHARDDAVLSLRTREPAQRRLDRLRHRTARLASAQHQGAATRWRGQKSGCFVQGLGGLHGSVK